MSSRTDLDLLKDIKECINRIRIYIGNMKYEDFVYDYKTQDAVIRNLEIIGEATKILSNELKINYPEIPWKNIAGTRDKLIHDYFGVNIDIIWNIVTEDISLLVPKLHGIIEKIANENSS
jgi:uncharacterized protein with HEPN domain